MLIALLFTNHLRGAMISVLASWNVIDYKISMCCYSAVHEVRSKSEDRLARNQKNVFELSGMCTQRVVVSVN